eukprot:5993419-Prymnesium_polylepis.1
MVEGIFADLPSFDRFVQRLDRLSMPGVDPIRFEHLQTLVRSGHAAVLRSFVLLVCGVGTGAGGGPTIRLRWAPRGAG